MTPMLDTVRHAPNAHPLPRVGSRRQVTHGPEAMGVRKERDRTSSASQTALAREPRIHLLLLTALGLLAFLPWLSASPIDGTEGHRAVTAHQMLTSGGGRWLVPHLYGQVYLTKPPLIYWMLAAGEWLLGPGPLAWRLPSVLAAVALAGVMWVMARRWFGGWAGSIAAGACLGLVTLWSQSRSAQIDAMNTLAGVTAALIMIELAFASGGRGAKRWMWSAALALAFGAMLLLKGPAGVMPVLGVIVGSSVATRSGRVFKQPTILLGLLGGIALLLAWAVPASRAVGLDNLTGRGSGVGEVSRRLSLDDLGTLLAALTMPLQLALLAMPLPIALWVGSRRQMQDAFEPEPRRLLNACLGAAAAALLSCAALLIANPRYGYITLPMLCPVVGAVGEAWRRGLLSQTTRKHLRAVATVTTAALGLAAVTLIVLAATRTAFNPQTAIYLIGGALLTSIVGIRRWIEQDTPSGARWLAATTLIAALAFGVFHHSEPRRADDLAAALAVRAALPGSASLHVAHMAQHFPAVLYHAGLPVERHRDLHAVFEQREACWLLLTSEEWAEWQPRISDRLSDVTRTPNGKAYLAHLNAPTR